MALAAAETSRRYSSREVVDIAEITYRQLDYWTRGGLFSGIDDPRPGSGVPRSYSEADVELAYALRILLDAGVSMDALARAIRHDRLEPMLRQVAAAVGSVLEATTSSG